MADDNNSRSRLPRFLMRAGKPAVSTRGGAISASRTKTLTRQFAVAQSGFVSGAVMTGQECDYWCWAASTQCIKRARQTSTASQADIAHGHIRTSGRNVTCQPSAPHSNAVVVECGNLPCQTDCDTPHWLRIVLDEHRLFDRTAFALGGTGSFAFNDLQHEIDNGRPIGCRVRAASGHFIVIAGWVIDAEGTQRVQILDPAAQGRRGQTVSPLSVAFDSFMSAGGAQGWGPVTHIYMVK